MVQKILGELDGYDKKILQILALDGRITVTDLAKRIGLSKSPCQVRLNRLRSLGYIKGFRAILDAHKLGLDHVAFVEIKLKDTTEGALRAFNEAITGIAEIEQCHMIAGSFDYLLKVRTADIKAYRQLLGEQISNLPHLAHSATYVAMQAVKESGF